MADFANGTGRRNSRVQSAPRRMSGQRCRPPQAETFGKLKPQGRPLAMPPSADHWIAERMRSIESSGIRKVFDLARSLKDPVNLSIGQPDFDVPAPIKAAA